MKTKIIALATLIALTSTAQAGYMIVIPMEQSKGGPLPNGSISIKPRTPSLPAENWQPTEPLLGEWINNGAIYGCSNWTPATSTKPIGFIFQQTADDCKQDQTTTKQDREKETTTLAYRNVGQPTTETKSIPAHSSRQATGTKENWQAAEPLYGEWANKGEIYGCNWTPAASLVLRDEPFNQTEIDCKQDQIRTKQDREKETTTLAFRNIGTPTIENKTTNAVSDRTQTATGTATCIFNQGGLAPSTQWLVAINLDSHLLQVNSNILYNGQGKYSTTLIINGKTYKRGNIKATTNNYLGQPEYNYHEVCK